MPISNNQDFMGYSLFDEEPIINDKTTNKSINKDTIDKESIEKKMKKALHDMDVDNLVNMFNKAQAEETAQSDEEMTDILTTVKTKINDFRTNHPTLYVAICWSIPTIIFYKFYIYWESKAVCEGILKAFDKIDSDVWIG